MKILLFTTLALMVIMFCAACAYFYKLDTIPSGFYVDEASVAYNAYSIATTGKDEYGFPMPIYFRLMGSYTPSVFIYVAAGLIKLVGMSIVLFRSLSALSMLASIVVVFLILKELGLYKLKLSYFVVTFFYALCPWIVFNARLGYETTLGFLIFNIGAYFLLLSRRKAAYLVVAVLLLSISTYVSHNQRFLAPLFLAGCGVLFRKHLFTKKNRKILIGAFSVGLLSQLPNIAMLTTNAFWIKSAQFSLNYAGRSLVYLSPKTLFFDNPDIDLQHTLPQLSMLYDWMVFPYFTGLYLLSKGIKDVRHKFLTWFGVVALIPSVFSGYFISSQRVLPFVIPLIIIIGLGMDAILARLKPLLRPVIVVAVACYSLALLTGSYFALFPVERAHGWNYGYDQLSLYINANPQRHFVVDDTRNPRAYILLLYFLKVPPSDYQNQIDPYYRDNYYVAPPPAKAYSFSNVEVRSIDWETDPKQDVVIVGDSLAISDQQAREHNLVKINDIRDLSDNVVFNVFETTSGL